METGRERLSSKLKFPLIVKPNQEGSSKGVSASASVVDDEEALRAVVRELIDRYRQPALIEVYIPGREFTVGLLGDRRPRVLPPMEILFKDKTNARPVYDFQIKQEWEKHVCYQCPAHLSPAELKAVERVCRETFDGARLPRRRARRSAHDAEGRHLRHRGEPAAGADAGLLGPVPDRAGGGHRVPHADRRDPRRRAEAAAREAARGEGSEGRSPRRSRTAKRVQVERGDRQRSNGDGQRPTATAQRRPRTAPRRPRIRCRRRPPPRRRPSTPIPSPE